jgi:hypothetical protein
MEAAGCAWASDTWLSEPSARRGKDIAFTNAGKTERARMDE